MHQPTQHTHPVGQQATIGRVMYGRFDDGAMRSLRPRVTFKLHANVGHAVQQDVERLGLNGVGPAQ